MVFVRQRPAVIKEVTETKGIAGSEKDHSVHLVSIEYIDGNDFPKEDKLVWEREKNAKILSKIEFPKVDATSPDSFERFIAFRNGIKWASLGQYFNFDKENQMNTSISTYTRLSSPWKSAIKIEDYQLVPVLKALNMNRVRLLLADGVGLGKTIQAGLIITELIHQRHIRKILIVCPASLQYQWKDEMQEKFNLKFTIVDSTEAIRIQRRIGIDTNPWSAIPRIITSMDYLRQADINEKFQISAKARSQITKRVWDLLIVDEAHNFSPLTTHESQRTKMLREVAKWFEHRLFLTATPHNGFTLSYTGLLELLDPMKFYKTGTLEESMKENIKEIVVRRLKSDFVNEDGDSYFAPRYVETIDIILKEWEVELFTFINEYKDAILNSNVKKREQKVHIFIFTLLIKRLLSSTYAFARTWWVHMGSIAKSKNEIIGREKISYQDANAAITRASDVNLLDEQRDDLEKTALSIATIASENKVNQNLEKIRTTISRKLNQLELTEETLSETFKIKTKTADTKLHSLKTWVKNNLIQHNEFKNDERLIVFTEYKDTQKYIQKLFEEKSKFKDPQVKILHGTTNRQLRNELKQEFNDKNSPIRILIATDTASEGLNMQQMCRYVIHYDIPWNPAKLEQRNGRVDRHGQARDVKIFHFHSKNNQEMIFLSKVASKVNKIQDDLGHVGIVLSSAIDKYFREGKKVDGEFENIQAIDNLNIQSIKQRKKEIAIAKNSYQKSLENIGISPEEIANLFTTMFKEAGGDFEKQTSTATIKVISTVAPKWEKLINNSLIRKTGKFAGQIPKLVFSSEELVQVEFGREIFKNKPGQHFITLGHPIMQRVLTSTKQSLWDNVNSTVARWIISQNLTTKQDILEINIMLTIRNQLGETLHSEFLRYFFEINESNFRQIHEKMLKINPLSRIKQEEHARYCKRLWMKFISKIEKYMKAEQNNHGQKIKELLPDKLEAEIQQEKMRYIKIKEELKQLKSEKALQKRIDNLKIEENKLKQMLLNSTEQALREEHLKRVRDEIQEKEWKSKNEDYVNSILDIIDEDHKHMLKIIPKRYSTKDSVEFHPVGIIFHLNINNKEE